jgi:hypothetical protein
MSLLNAIAFAAAGIVVSAAIVLAAMALALGWIIAAGVR